jgi:hypothetical protein
VTRLTASPEVTLALFELRLEAARRPEVADVLRRWQQQGFDADVAFHHALDGLLLDRLTTSIDAGTGTDAVVQALVDGLLPPGSAEGPGG